MPTLTDFEILLTTGTLSAVLSATLTLIFTYFIQRRRRRRDRFINYFAELNRVRAKIWSIEKYDITDIEARGEVISEDFEPAKEIFSNHDRIFEKYRIYFDADIVKQVRAFKEPIEDFYFHEKWRPDDTEYNAAHLRAWEHTFKYPYEVQDAIDKQISRLKI